MPNSANYMEQGGALWVIGGTLDVNGTLDLTGSTVTGLPAATATVRGGVKASANQAASTAAALADLVTDFNALLTKLKAAGVMIADT